VLGVTIRLMSDGELSRLELSEIECSEFKRQVRRRKGCKRWRHARHHSAGGRRPNEHRDCHAAGDRPARGRPMGRFAGLRLDGLLDEPHPRAPRKIGHEEITETFRRTLEVRPSGTTHWSLRRPQSSSLDGV
jgi:hypothetical protein